MVWLPLVLTAAGIVAGQTKNRFQFSKRQGAWDDAIVALAGKAGSLRLRSGQALDFARNDKIFLVHDNFCE
jgi:hypothetical protein